MEAASDDRYWDSLTCALSDRDFAACYLMGYAIETLMKTAFFRFAGVPVDANLASSLKTATKHPLFAASKAASAMFAHGLHNVRAWAEYLIDARQRASGQALDPVVAGKLIFELSRFQNNWSEVLRYRASVAASAEFARFLAIADWLRDHYAVLWR